MFDSTASKAGYMAVAGPTVTFLPRRHGDHRTAQHHTGSPRPSAPCFHAKVTIGNIIPINAKGTGLFRKTYSPSIMIQNPSRAGSRVLNQRHLAIETGAKRRPDGP
jgi:hypothetical protein